MATILLSLGVYVIYRFLRLGGCVLESSRFRLRSIGVLTLEILRLGVFALGEVLGNMESDKGGQMLPVPKGLRNLLPTWAELKACRFAFLQGSVIGFLIGVLPGAGSTIASFISYGIQEDCFSDEGIDLTVERVRNLPVFLNVVDADQEDDVEKK